MAKQNFTFYCSQKKSGPALEVYELPMILSACGYKTTAEIHNQLSEYLVQQKKVKLDWTALVQVLTQLKKLELAQDPTNEGDEYIDAFVALGGEPDKSGFVQKDMLIEIIKIEFELTIDMVVRHQLTVVGVFKEDRGRERWHRLLSVLRTSRRWNQRQPIEGEQLSVQ